LAALNDMNVKQMDEIKIGIGTSSIGRFLPLVGQAAGLFQKANIAVEIVNQQDEEKVVEDIVAQATPVGTPNAPSLIFSLLNGNDLVIVGGILNRPAFYLAANETIARLPDIKGKRIGINQPRRMAGLVMLALLRSWGVDTERDLTLVDFGLNDRSFEALRTGEVDAALLPPEKAFLLETEGFHLVADSLALDCHWVPLATTRRFLAANRDLINKIVSIYMQSIHLFKIQPQQTLAEVGRWLPALAGKPLVLERCYKLFAERFEPTLTPSLSSIGSVLKEVALQDSRAKGIEGSSLVERLL
jgi:ABC-type nitrate/sulfonate/bicarbonate transport system substrate-binding protein